MNKALGTEGAICIATTKIARANFPNQITPVFTVVPGNRPLACVVSKATLLGTQVQRHDGIGTQSAEAHGRDIEQADIVRVFALRAAHRHSEVMRINDRGTD